MVGLEGDLRPICEQAAVLEEPLERHEALGRLLLARVGRGEVDGDARQLAGGEEAHEVVAEAGDDEGVAETLLDDVLGGVYDADRLAIQPDEQHVGLGGGGCGEEGALAAAHVEAHLAEGRAADGRAGIGPASGEARGLELDGVGVALEALLEHEVPGKACVKAVHGRSEATPRRAGARP